MIRPGEIRVMFNLDSHITIYRQWPTLDFGAHVTKRPLKWA